MDVGRTREGARKLLVLFRRGRLGIQLKDPGVTVGEGETVDANRVLECLGEKMGRRSEWMGEDGVLGSS